MSSEQTVAVAGRPRRWWLALLMNFVAPPTGYAYVGAWRMVAAFGPLLAILALGLMAWTISEPPGVYAGYPAGLAEVLLVPSMALAAHAAWLARRAQPATGSRIAHLGLYLATLLVPLIVLFGVRAFSPQSTYSMASDSMEPSLHRGDIVGVAGARAICGGVSPKPGQVVIYRQPKMGSARYMHRVVAGPGQTVAMENGRLIIDGAPVHLATSALISVTPGRESGVRLSHGTVETLANGANYRILNSGPDTALQALPTVHLAQGQWYILGDSRGQAIDSSVTGPIPAQNICGVVVRILQSGDKSHVGARP